MPPRSSNRVSILLAALIVATLGALVVGPRPRGAKPQPSAPAVSVQQAGTARHDTTVDRILDEVGVYVEGEQKTERWLGLLHDELGVDLRVILVREIPDQSIEAYATRRMRELGVGRSSSGRGLLFVYDLANERLRIEVGPGLDDIVTDAFVGYLMSEHAAAFFAQAGRNPELGLRTTVFIVQRRLREAALGKTFDPAAIAAISNPARIAAGAGVTRRAGPGGDSSAFLQNRLYPDDLVKYAEQPTVSDAYYRYVDWLREDRFLTQVPLFTPETREFWGRYPVMTRAFADYLLYGRHGHGFTIHERGDLALLVFTTTPFESPHHFRRTPKGWQVDIRAEIRNSQEWIAYHYTWTMKDSGDEYCRAFKDLWVKQGRAWRIKGGDNRKLPVQRLMVGGRPASEQKRR